MKKRIILIVILLWTEMVLSALSSWDEMKWYGSGWAHADYLGMKYELISGKEWKKNGYNYWKTHGYKLSDCQKLSKQESSLVWAALDEYELEDDEVYAVYVTLEQNVTHFLNLYVIIKNNGNNVDWEGFYIDMGSRIK